MSQGLGTSTLEINLRFRQRVLGITDDLKNTIEAFQKSTKRILKIGDSLQVLAKVGWYAPMTLTHAEINKLAGLIFEDKINQVDEYLVSHLDYNYQHVENSILAKFPHREKPLRAALSAHSKNEFYLSIPVFYAQIDGVFSELTKTSIFQDVIGDEIPENSKMSKWIDEADSDALIGMLLQPLRIINPLKKVENFKNKDLTNPINRHAIVHGRSLSYGEDVTDAYKVLSLLNYVCETVYRAREKLNKNSS